MGYSAEEAQEEWDEYKSKADASNSDNKGRKGRFRLWLHLRQFKDKSETLSNESSCVEQDMTTKGPTDADRDAMRLHVIKNEAEGVGDELFRGQSTLASRESPRKRDAPDPGEQEPPTKKSKTDGRTKGRTGKRAGDAE